MLKRGDLADKLGMDQASISLIENRRANPTLNVLEAVAAALGAKPSDLLDEQA